MRVLITYASDHGHTAKIADRLAEAIRAEGVEVDLNRAEENVARPEASDAVIVAGSLHAGKHQKELVEWVKQHRSALDARPTLFVSVSLTAADESDEAQSRATNCIDEFVEQTGWQPKRSTPVAGSLQYREYNVFQRVLMRQIVRSMGHPEPDTSHDHDYTDWEAVERLGRQFAADLVASDK